MGLGLQAVRCHVHVLIGGDPVGLHPQHVPFAADCHRRVRVGGVGRIGRQRGEEGGLRAVGVAPVAAAVGAGVGGGVVHGALPGGASGQQGK
ncbi:MAG: hypothetical protein ACK559_01670, partial [bacterium]